MLTTAVEAYDAGRATYTRYKSERAQGRSETEAIGAIVGGIAGGAACAAAGAGALAPVCVSLGGIVGKALGGLFGSGASDAPDFAPAICAHVERALDDLAQDAAANGVSLPRAQLRAWFADAADRASLARPGAPAIQIKGEIGKPPADLIFPSGKRYPLNASGFWPKPAQSAADKLKPPTATLLDWQTYRLLDWQTYRLWLPWNPDPSSFCLWPGTTVRNPKDVIDMAGVGLSAVAARIANAAELRRASGADTITIRGGRIVSSAGPATAGLFVAAGVVLGWIWWRTRRKRQGQASA